MPLDGHRLPCFQLDALTEGVIILDGQKRIALANESFSKLMGKEPEELRGQTIDDLPWMRSATEDPGPAASGALRCSSSHLFWRTAVMPDRWEKRHGL